MTRSFRRTALVAASLLLGGLAACSTDNDIAARVGSETITVAQLDAAVARGYADPDIGEAAKEAGATYRRTVLTLMIQDKIYAAAAKEHHIDYVDEDVVAMEKELLGGQAPREAIQAAIQAGQPLLFTPEDISTISTAQLVSKLIGESLVDTSDAAKHKLYEERKATLQSYTLGYISVPDQVTATTIQTELQADPSTYATLAAQYAGQNTLAAPEPIDSATLSQNLPPALAQAVTTTPAGNSVVVDLAAEFGVFVAVYVASVTTPTYEELAEQLTEELAAEVPTKGLAAVAAVGKKLDVWINPRFGSLGTDQQGLPSVNGGSGTGTFKILTPDSAATQPPTQ